MKTSGNTLLITGGGSGIGRGLAEAFHHRGNHVIIAGRRAAALKAVTDANPGMAALTLDLDDPADIRRAAAQLMSAYPSLNAVVHSAGIMKAEDLIALGSDSTAAEATIQTNLLAPMRLNAALLTHLLGQPEASILTVSSGLAFVPLATTPAYSASKAAIHAYSQSLRYQLRDTRIEVIEIVPPYVRTGLMGERQANDPAAMPLDDFISEVFTILETSPQATEICVERVKPLRFAERSGDYDAFYAKFNEAMSHHR